MSGAAGFTVSWRQLTKAPAMLRRLIVVRFAFLLGFIFVLFNALLILGISVARSIEGYRVILEKGLGHGDGRPAVLILESLDLLLISIVFFILGFGILRIFIIKDESDEDIPKWLRIHSFMELKALLWETILLTLVVLSFTRIVSGGETLTLDALILPGVILLLGLALLIVKKSHEK
jgi:uncharacterized membrane protein YqhA